jgi:hypothetical protein
MLRYLSAFFLGFVSIASLATDDEPVKRPYVEVGDCWTYRSYTISRAGKSASNGGGFKLCITFVDHSKDVVLAVSNTNDGRELDFAFTGEWNPIANTRNVLTEVPRFLKFPLHVGDTHSFDYEWRRKSEKMESGRTRFNMKVIGWEDVVVPAGTFRALRLEGIGIGRRTDLGNSGQYEDRLTGWYVPAVNRYVKWIFGDINEQRVEELAEYRLNK